MIKEILEIKEEIKATALRVINLPEGSRELSLVRTKLEEACMWADYELRLNGIDPSSVVDMDDVEEPENEMEKIVSGM